MTVFSLDKLGQCRKRAPDLSLNKIGQISFKLYKKLSSKMEAAKLVGIQGLHLDRTAGMIKI